MCEGSDVAEGCWAGAVRRVRTCSRRELVHYGLRTTRRGSGQRLGVVAIDGGNVRQQARGEREEAGLREQVCGDSDVKCAGLAAAEGNDRSSG